MIFSKEILIPAQTVAEDPLVTFAPISLGALQRVWVRWRWGSGNLCGVRILYAAFQIYPLTMTEWFVSTPYPLEFEDDRLIDGVPTEIEIQAYNNDDTFGHRVWVAFSVLRPAAIAVPAELAAYMPWGA